MRLLNTNTDIRNLFNAVNECQDKVILRSADGTEEYDLKSILSLYAAVGELCKDRGDAYEFYCCDRRDEKYIMKFLMELDREGKAGKAA